MRIEIHCPDRVRASDEVRIRALLFNDTFEPVTVLRRAFVGPNVGDRRPQAVEPDDGAAEQPLVLQPFTFYGRERPYDGLPPGEVEITAHYTAGDGRTEATQTRTISVAPA